MKAEEEGEMGEMGEMGRWGDGEMGKPLHAMDLNHVQLETWTFPRMSCRVERSGIETSQTLAGD
ncbi:MAG: hypothetical protein MJA27_16645 [Pseudanabaenales cyanobacterium]|nr:hypothetical protein [Pseudanabaenales cyanobacterium]